MSRHFTQISPLNTNKQVSDTSRLRLQPQRKEVFFRSGKAQALHKMTLNESLSGEIPGISDFSVAGSQSPQYLSKANENPDPNA